MKISKYNMSELDAIAFLELTKGKKIRDPDWTKSGLYRCKYVIPTGEYYWDKMFQDWVIVTEDSEVFLTNGLGEDTEDNNYWELME